MTGSPWDWIGVVALGFVLIFALGFVLGRSTAEDDEDEEDWE